MFLRANLNHIAITIKENAMVNEDVKDLVVEINSKEEFYDFLIKCKNIDINNSRVSRKDMIINIGTFTGKTKFFLCELSLDDISDIEMLISYFGYFTPKKWKTNNLISGNEAIEDFYNHRVEKANKYLAEKRKRVLNKVIAEAIESNEFLAEVDEGFKL